jgi:CheY-like chemotaxis protein
MASILIVDDDLDGSEAVARMLRRSGHRAVCVPNGREALAMLTGALPDLVLLDVRMPEMDGITFLQVLRSYLRWQNLPVILLTAFAQGPHIGQAAKMNVTDVFCKGQYEFSDLLAAVDRLLRGNPKPPRSGWGPGTSAPPPA